MSEPTVPAPTTLYIFPHAGGSPQYYIPFAKALGSAAKCVAVQYPGRGGTHDLASFTGIPDLADRACRQLEAAQPAGPVAFFGYSMGGLVAFEVAQRLQAAGKPVAALFVSACAAPGRSGYDYIPESDRGLLDAVSQMTGLNPEFLENEEFAAKILPTLRGFRAIVDYRCPPEAVIASPIHTFHGDDDEVATAEKVAPWAQRTTGEFTRREFAGHHFFLDDHLAELAGDVADRIARLRATVPA